MSGDLTTAASKLLTIRTLIADPVPSKSFYGLEIRGLMALMIDSVEIRPHRSLYSSREDQAPIQDCYAFDIDIHWKVPSVIDGNWIELTYSVKAEPGFQDSDTHGRMLTPEQTALQGILEQLWKHEWDEAIAMDGQPLGKPEQLHSFR